MTEWDGGSLDEREYKKKKLAELFPECMRDGKVDLEALKYLADGGEEDVEERYEFTWPGKRRALRLSRERSRGTLLPDRERSVFFDTSRNLFVEGENLETLKLLQKSYFGKVKLIYIDPPYNTDGDFVYPDSYRDSLKDYLKLTGQKDGHSGEAGGGTDGRFHTRWLNMMYPRLRLSRNLLREDGLILINIDEHEYCNLQKLMGELYGESNDLGTVIWDKRNPKGDAKGISGQHEYILFYAKNKEEFLKTNQVRRPKKNAPALLEKARALFAGRSETYTLEDINRDFAGWVSARPGLSGGERAYRRIDENGDVYRAVSMAWPNKKGAPDSYFIPLIHPVTKKPCPVPERGWRNPPETMERLLKDGMLLFGKDETTQPTRKYLLKDNLYEKIPSVLYYGGSDDELLKRMEIPFDTPKPLEVVTEHVLSLTKGEDIVLDFFAGSGTTAHAVMKANLLDGGERRYILIQLPEPVKPSHAAYRQGYRTVSRLTRERLVRAGGMLVREGGKDPGFKMFVLESSNFKQWRPDAGESEESILDSIDNLVPGRTHEDAVYELLLKLGEDPAGPVAVEETECGTVYVAGSTVMLCMEDTLCEKDARTFLRLRRKYPAGKLKLVLRDQSFASDSEKFNMRERMREAGCPPDAFLTV